MAHGKSITLAAIQPGPRKWIAQGGTLFNKETVERHRAAREEFARAHAGKKKRDVVPHLSFAALELAAMDRQERAEFRARKRAWRAGAQRVVQRMFDGLEALLR